MSAEERDLLAAECPRPDTYNRMLFLCRAFINAMGHTPPVLRRVRVDFMWGCRRQNDDLNETFDRYWSTFSIFQREEILVAWVTEILTGASK